MTDPTVPFVGLDPALMKLDAAPAGTAAAIRLGIDRSMREPAAAGCDARYCALAEGDDGAERIVRAALAERPFACVVIGAGLRLLPAHTALFESLVNAVVQVAPGARLAFDVATGDAADAVRRQPGEPAGAGHDRGVA